MICPFGCTKNGDYVDIVTDQTIKKSRPTTDGSNQRIRACVCPSCGQRVEIVITKDVEITPAGPRVIFVEEIYSGFPV